MDFKIKVTTEYGNEFLIEFDNVAAVSDLLSMYLYYSGTQDIRSEIKDWCLDNSSRHFYGCDTCTLEKYYERD